MKKKLSLTLALAMLLTLPACGGPDASASTPRVLEVEAEMVNTPGRKTTPGSLPMREPQAWVRTTLPTPLPS